LGFLIRDPLGSLQSSSSGYSMSIILMQFSLPADFSYYLWSWHLFKSVIVCLCFDVNLVAKRNYKFIGLLGVLVV